MDKVILHVHSARDNVMGLESTGLETEPRIISHLPRAGPKLTLSLHIKTPSFRGPAVAPKATEVS